MKIVWIIWAVVILLVVLAVIFITYKIKSFFRRTSNMVFGTNSIKEGLEQQADILSKTPKSVSGMTRIYLPQIIKDFPEFNLEEFKLKSENMIKSAFAAITGQNISLLLNGSCDLVKLIEYKINEDIDEGIITYYDNVKIHCTEITTYHKYHGSCVVTLQSALEYFNYTTQDGVLKDGSRDRLVQTKYNISLVYVQDEEIASKYSAGRAVGGLKCPNCGANITNLGNKKCEYCGSNAHEVNIYAWKFNKFSEVSANTNI